MKLKYLVNEKLPQCKFWLSIPKLRTDNGEATFDNDAVSESSITVILILMYSIIETSETEILVEKVCS